MATTEPALARTAHAAGPAPLHVLLLEPQPDHAEVVREQIEAHLPGAVVHSAAEELPPGHRPDIVIIADDATPSATVDAFAALPPGERPALVLLSAGNGRTAEAAARYGIPPQAVLDKRRGTEFLRALPVALAGLAQDAIAEAEPPTALPAPPAPAAAADEPAIDAAAHLHPAGAIPAVARDLAAHVAAVLGDLAPLAEMLSRRGDGDGPARGYLAGVASELARAAAIASRLTRLLDDGCGARPLRRCRAADIAGLRLAAWRGWLGGATVVEVTATDGAPQVDVDLGLLGPVLDDLLLEVARGGTGTRVAVDGLTFDAAFVAAHLGASLGRHARIAIQPLGVPQAAAPASLASLAAEQALAAAKAHGGYFERLPAAAGGGFAIYLPAVRDGVREGLLRGGPPTALVIDDEDPVREVAEGLLQSGGWHTTAVRSGYDGVALYRAGCRYDIVLLDLMMAGMDGVATFRELRQLDAGVRVVMASGTRPSRPVREVLAAGAMGFLAKPYTRRELLDAVRAAAGH